MNVKKSSRKRELGKPSPWADDTDYVPTIFSHQGDKNQKRRKGENAQARYKRLLDKRLAGDQKKLSTAFQSRPDDTGRVAVDTLINCPSQSASKFVEKGVFPSSESELESLREENKMLHAEVQSLLDDVHQLKNENHKLKEKTDSCKFSFSSLKNNLEMFHFFTGVYTVATFLWILNIVRDRVTYVKRGLCIEDHLLIVLVKLKMGLMSEDIAHRFGVSAGTISKIISKWVPCLAGLMKELVVWPKKETVRQHLPRSFRKKFGSARCIIDYIEIFMERPHDLTARAQTYSKYRHHNTVKYLVAVTPAGAVSFISLGYGGRISDKEIATWSGFFKLLEYGDEILADREFLIREELAVRGATLKTPHFIEGKKQFSGGEVDTSRQLSREQIHVERVIGKMRSFHILQSIIPVSQIHLLDDFVTSVGGLINLAPSIVPVVFLAHVLDKLYPPETTQEDASTSTQECSTKFPSKKSAKATPPNVANAKVYTVQLPPEGLPEAEVQASNDDSGKHLGISGCGSDSSEETEDDDDEPLRVRKRKKKHRRKASKCHSSEKVPASSLTCNPHSDPTTGPKEGTNIQTFPVEEASSKSADSSSLTKNQRKKLRKKRAKLGRLGGQPSKRATEFVCDVDENDSSKGDADGDGDDDGRTKEHYTLEVKEFMEAVWRVLSCDGSKAGIVVSQTQPFQAVIEKLAHDSLLQQTVDCLKEIKQLLVLQDFTRARTRLAQLRENQSAACESDIISLFSTLAEYWMTDVAAPD